MPVNVKMSRIIFEYGMYQVSMHLLRFLVVLGDVSILMETKHFRMRNNGKTANVVYIALELSMGWGMVDTAGREPDV